MRDVLAPPRVRYLLPSPRTGIQLSDLRHEGALRRQEWRLVRDAEALLAHQALPAGCVVWYPGWDATRPVLVDDAEHLALLIDGLLPGRWGGVRNHPDRGPWAQAKRIDRGPLTFELHPHDHAIHGGIKGCFCWLKIPASAACSASASWQWVRSESFDGDGFEKCGL